MERMLRQSLGHPTGQAHRGWFCPDEATLAAYVDGQLEGGPRAKIEQHLAGCEHCLGQVSFLVRAKDEELTPEVPPGLLARAKEFGAQQGVPVFQPDWRWATVAGVTAVFAVVIAVSLRQPQWTAPTPQPPTPPGIHRSEPPPQGQPETAPPRKVRGPSVAAPDLQLISPREGAVLPRERLSFEWRPVRGAVWYEVRVTTDEGALIWELRTEATQVVVPRTAPVETGKKYFVWVVAQLPGGATVKARAVAFQVAPAK